MTLYNKDGTVYKLDGPNPIMKTQDFWEEFSVHNMKWKTEVHKDKGGQNVSYAPKKEPKTQSEVFLDELESSKNVNLDTSTVNEKKKEEEKKEPSHISASTQSAEAGIEKTFVHCLPASIKEKKDSLYGDVSLRISYGNKTSFEAVILNQGDMTIEMWSEAFFEKGSILYPRNGDKRWWKVQEVYPKLGGYVIRSVPSQDQPYFE